MTQEQLFILRCALADLTGAYQAYQQSDIHIHDWKGHFNTILDLSSFLGEEVPESLYGDEE